MKRLARAGLITSLAERLRARGSWAGETHLQKASYFLQEAAGVPLDYQFILYKHGPFAFDLRDDLGGFSADRLLEVVPQTYPYGPRLATSPSGIALQEKFPKTLAKYNHALEAVADLVRNRGVGDLERLGTALLLIKEGDAEDDVLAARMMRVKPHVSESAAKAAIAEVREFLASLSATV